MGSNKHAACVRDSVARWKYNYITVLTAVPVELWPWKGKDKFPP